MSLIENLIPRRRGRPSKAVADANAAVEKLSADLTRLNSKRDELTTRQADAQAKCAVAKEARRSALASDPGADVESLSRTVRESEDQAQMFGDALADVESQIAAVTAERDNQDIAGKREEVAVYFEAITEMVNEAATDVDKAIASVGKAFEKLKSAIPENYALIDVDSPEWSWGASEKLASANDLAAIILAESLYKILPEAFIEVNRTHALYRFFEIGSKPTVNLWGASPPPLNAADAASQLIGERNRVQADAIRRGDVDLSSGFSTPAATPEQKKLTKQKHERVEIFATRDFRYVANTSPVNCWAMCSRRGKQAVPEPVANLAVAAGLALRIDTPEGQEAYEADQQYRATALSSSSVPVPFAEFHDLGDPLGLFEGRDIPVPRAPTGIIKAS